MSIWRRTCLSLVSIFVLVLLFVVAAVSYFYAQVPKLSTKGAAPVLAVPESSRIAMPAYSGAHPRLSGRPVDDFDYPIPLGEQGPVEPLFSGPLQYPFLCGKDRSRDDGDLSAQPLIDNQAGIGVPVYAVSDGELTEQVRGYSKDCLYNTRASYYYKRVDSNYFFPLQDAEDDIDKVVVDGVAHDFVVRLETGTINRFIYAIAVLAKPGDDLASPAKELWNNKLIYQLRGGVGIGRRQGNLKPKDVLKRRREQLAEGYAIVYSTANQTSNHYNIWLAEDTAVRVKNQFVSLYGEPEYTVGIGGSGGAIQQYLFGQNNPGLIDASIALYSYPDMASQTIYVMDCEPLEYYFERLAPQKDRWASWYNRTLVEGLSATDSGANYYQWVTAAADLLNGRDARVLEGGTECIRGWRGLTQLIHNPEFIHFPGSFSDEVLKASHWTHWEDVKKVYGVGLNGYANSTWDNRGVQYGLKSLQQGKISFDEFADINARVGGWKSPINMEPERLWFLGKSWFPIDFSAWSEQNHHRTEIAEGVVRRSQGNVSAISGAFKSGLVFSGYTDIPIIDLRHYLDDELDMHHSLASFSSRQRMIDAMGHADNQAIWMAKKPYTPIAESLQVLDRWLSNIHQQPDLSVAENRPDSAVDKCFDSAGELIAAGGGVWDGDWNGRDAGACMAVYPSYQTSREIAGGGVAGDMFMCQRQSVESAVAAGDYGDSVSPQQLQRLQDIFPEGVCDYTLAGVGEPDVEWRREMLASVASGQARASNVARAPVSPVQKGRVDAEGGTSISTAATEAGSLSSIPDSRVTAASEY